MRRDVAAQLFDCPDSLICVFARHEVFGLQLRAAAGREVHAEVGQAFVPRAGYAELLRATLCRMARDRMQFLCGAAGTIKLLRPCVRFLWIDTSLDPHLGGAMVLPIGEEAYAVAAAEDGIEIVLKLGERQILIDDLLHLIGRFEIERETGDDAECPQSYYGTSEMIRIFRTGEG